MFRTWTRKRLKAGQAWSVLVPDFDTSTDDFYALIREMIASKRLPDVDVCELELREEGPLSATRRYLRIRHDLFIFDVCSAPYGTSWYFSCRQGQYPLYLWLWQFALLVGLGGLALWAHVALLGPAWGGTAFALNVASFFFLLNSLMASGLYGLAAVVLKIPLLGQLYEVGLRKDSYRRADVRAMFLTTVDGLVRDAVERTASVRPEGSAEFFEEPSLVGRWLGRLRDRLSSLGQRRPAASNSGNRSR
jgi:hypothetical protein